MRTWYVSLRVLDQQRLLAQHREIHALLGAYASPKFGYRNHPVTKLYESAHRGCLLDYHEATVREMQNRGWTGHKTPVALNVQPLMRAHASWEDHAAAQLADWPEHGLDRDAHELAERWEREHKLPRNSEAAEMLWAHANRHSDDQECHSRVQVLTNEHIAEMLDVAERAS